MESFSLSRSLKTGWFRGWQTAWILSKVIFPVTLLVSVLKNTPLMDVLVRLFAPLMSWVGLPGEAAVALVMGMFVNLYAAIGALLSLDLTIKEAFIVAVMTSFAHNLLVETAVTRQVGVSVWFSAGLRVALALVSGAAIHLFWQGGQSPARYSAVSDEGVASGALASGWLEIFQQAILTALSGIGQLILLVLPLMIGIQLLRDMAVLEWLSSKMSFLTRLLGVSHQGTLTLVAGLVFGLAYGAGVIIESAREGNLCKKDLYLLIMFLSTCHAVVEDTLIFLPLGIPLWPLLGIRLLLALVLTILTAHIWRQLANKRQIREVSG